MKTWSKYIILIITFFAILWCKGEFVSPKENIPDLIVQLAEETESLSVDFNNPFSYKDSYFLNIQRTQKNTYRRDNGPKQLQSFIKTNNTTFLKASSLTINNLTHKNSTISEPNNRLIQLGKLII